MFGPPFGSRAAHIVQLGAVGVGEGLHQVFADFHHPLHHRLPVLVLLLLQLDHWSAAPARGFMRRTAGVRYVTGPGGLLFAVAVAKSAANLPEKRREQ